MSGGAGPMNGHEHQPAAWTPDVEIVVLDNGLVLTPWGMFKVKAIDKIEARLRFGPLMQAVRTTMTPIDAKDQPEVLLPAA